MSWVKASKGIIVAPLDHGRKKEGQGVTHGYIFSFEDSTTAATTIERRHGTKGQTGDRRERERGGGEKCGHKKEKRKQRTNEWATRHSGVWIVDG